MSMWLSKVFHALTHHMDSAESVREALLAAQKVRAKLTLETSSGGRNLVSTSSIEQVRDHDIVISQPTIGGLVHPLTIDEEIKLTFVMQSKHHTGQTKSLGRIKVAAGSASPGHSESDEKHVLHAYHLALPESLRVEDRRTDPRIQIGFEFAPQAMLYSHEVDPPVKGLVVDLSMTGARIRSPDAVGRLISGSEVFLKSTLPEPVGNIDDLVSIAYVDHDRRSSDHVVGVAFRQKIEGLAELIRGVQSEEAARRRAG